MPTTTGISFDGVNDQVAKAWTGKTASSNKKFTAAAWFELPVGTSEAAALGADTQSGTGSFTFGLTGSASFLGLTSTQTPFAALVGEGGSFALLELGAATISYGTKYFIMVVYDSAQATAANRLKVWFGPEGGAITLQSWTFLLGSTYPTLNDTLSHGTGTSVANDGVNYDQSGPTFYKGRVADVYWLDDVALADPSSLLNNYASAAAPGTYSGSYGNTGYHLDFSNAGSLGADSSGNGNNFTPAGGPTQLTSYFPPAGKTLVLAAGAFTINGQAITLRRGKVLSAAAASFAVNAQAVGLLRARKLPLAAGAFTVNAQALNFLKGKRLFVDVSAYTVNAQAVTFTRAVRKLAAAVAAYAVNGQAIGLLRGRGLATVAATFTVNEQPITLRRGRSLALAVAAYAVNGQAIGLQRGRRFIVDASGVVVNAQAMGMLVGKKLVLTVGAFTINEQPLTMRRGRAVAVAAGAFVVSGQALTLLRGKSFPLDVRTYTINEQAISFRRTIRFAVANASYNINAQSVGFFLIPKANPDITALYNKGLGKKRFWIAAQARDFRNRGR